MVRLAWAINIGCKFRTRLAVGSVAKGKGVHREVGSEGSRRQNPAGVLEQIQ